jgi:hypothetical protein
MTTSNLRANSRTLKARPIPLVPIKELRVIASWAGREEPNRRPARLGDFRLWINGLTA